MTGKTPTERLRESKANKVAENAAGLTIAERLTRRAKAQTVDLPLMDEDGNFSVIMRQPTRAEMDDLQKLQTAIQVEATQDAANKQMCEMLGDLCIDESLTYDYWMTGDYDMIDMIDIINKLFEGLVNRVKAARSFRAN